ncbi:chorismate synthase [Comamonas sp. JC664]|uniref:chorismate synthase n=1 Tax=Comamonas sp. JC664 TaxID=2801917 RepID=UPI00174D53D8|nr:chorismate synthase [Comamonas sp. JC664]MBL0692070.1 chorismate synthase [Comamonas sp. JC664]GHG99146.1 chorismate synthase [Comamonas sp. KCTC 72670]
MNTFGELFRLTTFGESHGPALGAVLDGCPAGVPLTREQIQVALDRRRPGQSTITTARSEPDQVEILSGVFEDKTLGTPIAAIVRNTNQRSGDYEKLKAQDRPGHADAVWRERFKHRDHRGGGRTSGRETLCRVIGGAIAEAYLQRDLPAIRTVAYVSQVGDLVAEVPAPGLTREHVDAHATRCPDTNIRDEMSRRILTAKEAGDSLGGAIDVRVEGLPVGLGEPIFGKLKARIAQALGSIGAVTGVVWGPPDLLERIGQPGIQFHAVKDAYGGIQGGLANGEPMQIRTFFKPPATLQEHAKGGRHDPCIMPRAVPVLEAMVSLVIADLVLHLNARPHTL